MLVNRPTFCACAMAVAVLLGACSSGGGKASGPTTTVAGNPIRAASTTIPARGVSTRLELQNRTVVSGNSLDGDLVVDNRTSQPVQTPLCGGWEVQLTNDRVPVQRIVLFKCGPGPTFPVGVHRFPFTVDARYPCGPRPPAGVDCSGDVAPPLPPGYRAVLVQGAMQIPVPAPVTVRVVASGPGE
jgi:hypothetical protein